MGIIGYGGNVDMYGTDKNSVKICRVRANTSCDICSKVILKGSVCLGKEKWTRFCLNCQPKLFARIRAELRNFEGIMKETEADLKLNMEKYRSQNIVASI